MEILSTNRLEIREAHDKDTYFIFELLNSPNWIKHIGDRGIRDIVDALGYINDSLIKSYQENGFGLYIIVLKESNKPIGMSGYVQRTYLDHPDIGFAILPEYENQGLSFEAADALINYGKKHLKLQQIFGITSKENIGSQNLLLKIGLQLNGQITPPDSTEEILLYSLKE